MQKTIPVTVIEFLNFSSHLLKEKNIAEARLNAELILCEILNCDRVSLYLNFEKPLNNDEIKLLKEYLTRKIKHEPLQYITGKASFYGIDIKVNKHVLIPRPETELLTEKILTDIKKDKRSEVFIFEIGTGSGCISIAIATNLEKENISFDIFSIDISKEAVDLAKENLMSIGLQNKKIRFIEKDVFEIERLNRSFDYIISNPPYISLKEYNMLESGVKDFEPGLALTDFENGLKYYKKIFSLAADKEFNGKVFCEIGFGQKEEIECLLKENNFHQFSFYEDYNGIGQNSGDNEMTSVVQRVNEASVSIDGELYSKISKGLLILLGVCKDDTSEHSKALAKKIIDLRIFSDENEKMNLSVKDLGGEVLVISQFTLCSDRAKSGNRPSFANAELPEKANSLYEELVNEMKNYYSAGKIKTGVFAAKMEVQLINDGPVTIILDK